MRTWKRFMTLLAAGALAAGVVTTAAAQGGPQAADAAVAGSLIEEVQRALDERGYRLTASGTWNAETRLALYQFQQREGLEQTGRLNRATLDALGLMAPRSAGAQGEAEAVSASLVEQVQRALRQRGYNLRIDGQWGPATAATLRDFQERQGLTASGELTVESLAALDVLGPASSGVGQGSGQAEGEGGSALEGILNEALESAVE